MKKVSAKTLKRMQAMLKKQCGKCPLCTGFIYDLNQANIDHIIPKSRGGTNTLKNMQLAHKSCNHRRGNQLTIEDINRGEAKAGVKKKLLEALQPKEEEIIRHSCTDCEGW